MQDSAIFAADVEGLYTIPHSQTACISAEGESEGPDISLVSSKSVRYPLILQEPQHYHAL